MRRLILSLLLSLCLISETRPFFIEITAYTVIKALAAVAIAATASSTLQDPVICTQPGGCIQDILQLTAGQ